MWSALLNYTVHAKTHTHTYQTVIVAHHTVVQQLKSRDGCTLVCSRTLYYNKYFPYIYIYIERERERERASHDSRRIMLTWHMKKALECEETTLTNSTFSYGRELLHTEPPRRRRQVSPSC